MTKDIKQYNQKQTANDQLICDTLASAISESLADCKVWHAHPVWFIDGNPIVGYSKQKPGIRLMFWSGVDFDEEKMWVHLRKSNTEPIIRIYAEASTEERVAALADEVINLITEITGK